MFKLLFLLLPILFVGCSNHYAPLKTVEKVDIKSYAGTWYEIARYEHFFEKGCSDVSATYNILEQNKVEVINRCQKDGKLTEAKGIAYASDESFSKLKVSFFRPFYGDYQILILDENYKYVVIGEPSRKYFWILSREKTLEKSTLDMLLKKMPELGYDEKQLIWTPQN